jgi:hypothetical protein
MDTEPSPPDQEPAPSSPPIPGEVRRGLFGASHRRIRRGLAWLAAAAVAASAGDLRDRWNAERDKRGEKVWVEFRLRGLDSIWVPLPAGQPGAIVPGQATRFELNRDAGTFSFAGTFDGNGPGARGRGTFTFGPSPRYLAEMKALSYDLGSPDKLLEAALRDVSVTYVRAMQDLGYRNLGLDTLIELRARDVTPELIRELRALGYRDLSTRLLLEFRMYDVAPSFIRELASLHYTGLPAGRLVEFRIQDITPSFIRDLAALGYHDLPAAKLVEMKVQGVDIAFIRKQERRGYRTLSPDELIHLRMNGARS